MTTIFSKGSNEPIHLRQSTYQLWRDGGHYNPPGQYWDGTQYRRGNANTGMQYQQGGQTPIHLHQSAYQLWENGGQIQPMRTAEYQEYKDGGIHIKPENRGKFTAYKKRTGKTTEEALHSTDPHVRKMANFAKNAAKWKHQYGGNIYQDGGSVDGTLQDDAPPMQMQQRSPYQYPPVNWGQAAEQTIGAGIGLGTFLAGRKNARDAHQYTQNMGLTSQDALNGNDIKGDYNVNTGSFRDQYRNPGNQGAYYPSMMQHGGQYEQGGEYELDDREIKRLQKLGYKVQLM